MGKYDELSYSAIKKKHAAHLKSKKSRPDEPKFKEKEQKIKASINAQKLKLAEVKYEYERVRGTTEKLRNAQREKGDKLKGFQETLVAHKLQNQQVNQELVDRLGKDGKRLPKRIQDPKATLASFTKELATEKQRMRSEELSSGEERKIIRNIKVLEQNIQKVKQYCNADVEEVFKKKEETKKGMDEIRKNHQAAYDNLMEAKENANEVYRSLDSNKESQTEVQNQIRKLQEQREDASKKYKKSMTDWQQWQRAERELKSAMVAKQYDEELDTVSRTEHTKKSESRSGEVKKEAAAEKEKRQRAQEQLKSVEDRRKAAVEAYERCQSKLKKKAIAPPAGEQIVDDVVEVTSKKIDPHQAEKELCRHLIAYCQSNLPAEKNSDSPGKGKKKKRKRKKKLRLTHRPINFSNFAKVGVGIPIWSTDLQGCMKNLEERISSYDMPDVAVAIEEDVKDTSI